MGGTSTSSGILVHQIRGQGVKVRQRSQGVREDRTLHMEDTRGGKENRGED